MRRLTSRVALIVLAWAAVVLPAAMPRATARVENQKRAYRQEKGEKKKAEGRKESTVVVEVKCSGKPVGGATVFVQPASASSRESSTNSRGIAQFSMLPQEQITILVSADGYKAFSVDKTLTDERVTVAVELVKED